MNNIKMKRKVSDATPHLDVVHKMRKVSEQDVPFSLTHSRRHALISVSMPPLVLTLCAVIAGPRGVMMVRCARRRQRKNAGAHGRALLDA